MAVDAVQVLVQRVIGRFIEHRRGAPALPAPGQRDPLGPAGERVAARHLRRGGYRLLGRNIRVPMGEADLLARSPDRRTIVLVEVKSRRVDSASVAADAQRARYAPESGITAAKYAKLQAILRHLDRANRWQSLGLRVDVIALEWASDAPPHLRHHKGVIRLRSPIDPAR
jgi:putative endonuclease